MTGDCRLGKIGAYDGFCKSLGLLHALASYGLYFEQSRGSFAVPSDLLGQILVDGMKGKREFLVLRASIRNLRIACQTVSQQNHRIIGGSIPIYGYHVIGIIHVPAQRLLKGLLGNHGIRGNKRQHGAHVGVNHAGTFGHAADGHLLASHFYDSCQLFLAGIRCHDRLGCLCAILQRIILLFSQYIDARSQLIDRHLFSNDSGRAYEHAIFRDIQSLGRSHGSVLAIAKPFCSCACIGNSRVNHDRLNLGAASDYLLIPFDRRSLYDILRKCAGGHARRLAVDQRHIRPVLILDSCCRTCCFKSLCRGNPAFYDLHNSSSLYAACYCSLNAVIFFSFSTKS